MVGSTITCSRRLVVNVTHCSSSRTGDCIVVVVVLVSGGSSCRTGDCIADILSLTRYYTLANAKYTLANPKYTLANPRYTLANQYLREKAYEKMGWC